MRITENAFRMNTIALQCLQQLFSEHIIADIGNHMRFGPQLGCRYRLVATLTARIDKEIRSVDGLPVLWKIDTLYGQIHV